MARITNEKELAELVNATAGLRWGYIGNIERWGDDRLLRIWVPGLPRLSNGNTRHIWECDAKALDRQAIAKARIAIRTFKMGYAAALQDAARKES